GGFVARGDAAEKQVLEAVRLLEAAEAWRVRRRNVEHEIRGEPRETVDAGNVIGNPVLRGAIGTEIDARDAAAAPRREAAGNDVRPVIVEAKPVEDRLIGLDPEHPWLRVAGLGPRRHRSGLDETEADAQEAVDGLRVLVEARGKPHRGREIEPEGT